jgi:hypothetical protein
VVESISCLETTDDEGLRLKWGCCLAWIAVLVNGMMCLVEEADDAERVVEIVHLVCLLVGSGFDAALRASACCFVSAGSLQVMYIVATPILLGCPAVT